MIGPTSRSRKIGNASVAAEKRKKKPKHFVGGESGGGACCSRLTGSIEKQERDKQEVVAFDERGDGGSLAADVGLAGLAHDFNVHRIERNDADGEARNDASDDEQREGDAQVDVEERRADSVLVQLEKGDIVVT